MSPKITKNSNQNILRAQSDFFEIAKKSLTTYTDIPDIVTFAEDPRFLGRGRLYPRQKTLLRLICLETENMTEYDHYVIDEWSKNFTRNGVSIGVSPDIWERVEHLKANGYTHFREVVNITGRRGGKGHIGGIIGAYLNWNLLMLDDPQYHYGIDKSKNIYTFCHDDQTEILTPNGWVLFKDLSKDSTVGTVNKLGQLEFQKPTDYIDYHYDGNLIIGEKGTQYNFAVTPNHRMLVSNYFSKSSGFDGECVCGFKAASYLGLTTHMRHKKNSTELHGKKEIIDSTIDNLFFREASDLIGTERIPTAPWGAREDITSKIKIDVENYANYDNYKVSRTKDNFTFLKPEYIKSEPYNGKVYCLTVPNGTLITRRKGCTLVSSNCVATNIEQAKKYQFSDLLNSIVDAPCFQPYIADAKEHFLALRTPADVRRIAGLESRGIRPSVLIASVRAMAVTSNSKASRGAAAYSVIFDEFAHMLEGTGGARTSEEVYKAITPALRQFGKDGFIYVPSSPWTMIGKAYSLYENSLERNEDNTGPAYPSMMVCQLPSWGPYEDWDDPKATGGFTFRSAPIEYDEEMRLMEKREPDTYRVEYLSQWAEVTNSYLDPKMVERMFEPFIDAKGELRDLEKQYDGRFSIIYHGHCDPSKSGNNTAAMIGHVEQIPDTETGEMWFHIIIDWMQVWKPENYEDSQLDYTEIEEDLFEILQHFPTTRVFSFDQYGAFVTLPHLRKKLKNNNTPHKTIVREEKFTKESNFRRAERLKSSLGMNWVHAYRDEYGSDGSSLLEQELKFLQDKNGRVDKQKFGPIRTSDLADCLFVIVDNLLEDNFVKLQTRENLAKTELYPGAPGGYHTPLGSDSAPLTARQRLMSIGAARSQRDYGAMRRR